MTPPLSSAGEKSVRSEQPSLSEVIDGASHDWGCVRGDVIES